jgi:hypothetical protein
MDMQFHSFNDTFLAVIDDLGSLYVWELRDKDPNVGCVLIPITR